MSSGVALISVHHLPRDFGPWVLRYKSNWAVVSASHLDSHLTGISTSSTCWPLSAVPCNSISRICKTRRVICAIRQPLADNSGYFGTPQNRFDGHVERTHFLTFQDYQWQSTWSTFVPSRWLHLLSTSPHLFTDFKLQITWLFCKQFSSYFIPLCSWNDALQNIFWFHFNKMNCSAEICIN